MVKLEFTESWELLQLNIRVMVSRDFNLQFCDDNNRSVNDAEIDNN